MLHEGKAHYVKVTFIVVEWTKNGTAVNVSSNFQEVGKHVEINPISKLLMSLWSVNEWIAYQGVFVCNISL